jgi:hypothetical protein
VRFALCGAPAYVQRPTRGGTPACGPACAKELRSRRARARRRARQAALLAPVRDLLRTLPADAFGQLGERDRAIVRRYYGLEDGIFHTQYELAEEYGSIRPRLVRLCAAPRRGCLPKRAARPLERELNCRVGRGNRTPCRSQIPDVNLSIHPARAIQPTAVPPTASVRRDAARVGEPDEGAETLGHGCWRAVCICASPNGPDARRDRAGSGVARTCRGVHNN